MPCPFCSLESSRKWMGNDQAIAFADAYPVTEGHSLVIPRRHVVSIYELTSDEQSAVWALVAEVRARLLTGLKPDGLTWLRGDELLGLSREWRRYFSFAA